MYFIPQLLTDEISPSLADTADAHRLLKLAGRDRGVTESGLRRLADTAEASEHPAPVWDLSNLAAAPGGRAALPSGWTTRVLALQNSDGTFSSSSVIDDAEQTEPERIATTAAAVRLLGDTAGDWRGRAADALSAAAPRQREPYVLAGIVESLTALGRPLPRGAVELADRWLDGTEAGQRDLNADEVIHNLNGSVRILRAAGRTWQASPIWASVIGDSWPEMLTEQVMVVEALSESPSVAKDIARRADEVSASLDSDGLSRGTVDFIGSPAASFLVETLRGDAAEQVEDPPLADALEAHVARRSGDDPVNSLMALAALRLAGGHPPASRIDEVVRDVTALFTHVDQPGIARAVFYGTWSLDVLGRPRPAVKVGAWASGDDPDSIIDLAYLVAAHVGIEPSSHQIESMTALLADAALIVLPRHRALVVRALLMLDPTLPARRTAASAVATSATRCPDVKALTTVADPSGECDLESAAHLTAIHHLLESKDS